MKEIKIGVGVITMGVRKLADYKLSHNSELFVFTDHNKVGPASGRNECIKHLYNKGCDYIFLFDDDCFPTRHGWEDYFINNANNHNIHFLGLPEIFTGKLQSVSDDKELCYWDGIVGCFNFQTRHFIDVVGYYNTAYNRYGYEDAGRNYRAVCAGLTGTVGHYPSLLRASSYIHSEDVYGENPTPNISHEDKMKYIEENRKFYTEEIQSGQIFYPYSTK